MSDPMPRPEAPPALCCVPLLLLALLLAPLPLRAAPALEETFGPPLRVTEVESGSLLLRGAQPGALYPAPRVGTDVRMQVAGMVARVRVRQTFTNPSGEWLNGIYVFPLPATAAVDHMRLHVGGRVIEGRIEERKHAKRIYEEARDAGRKASLVEQERPNVFTDSVANVGPGETVRVTIEYQQAVRYEGGTFSLRFPMTVGVRYIPGTRRPGGFSGSGWAFDTDLVPDASRITPPVTGPHEGSSEGPGNPVSIDVDLQPGFEPAEVRSSYHAVDTRRAGPRHYRVRLAGGAVPGDRDFELRWRAPAGAAPRAALFSQRVRGETYGLLMLLPPATGLERKRARRELVYVIDTSGSMAGESIRQAKQALLSGLERLHPGDAFDVVEFDSTTRVLAPRVLPASEANLRLARRWVQGLRADGGTEMAGALQAALDGRRDAARVRQVVFITDGQVGNERRLFEIIRRRLGDSRLFTVGIGSAPNSYFMREAAAAGRGSFTHIGRTAEVAQKMGALFAKLEHPVLTGIEVAWADGGEADYWPRPVGDLYAGEPLTISFRRPAGTAALRVRGRLGGAPWEVELPAARGAAAEGLDVLWARRRIESLERRLARGAERGEVRAAITALGLAHHIVTAYTSLVAVDVTPSRPEGTASRDAAVPNARPHGWDMQLPQPRLPQTATPARLELLAGLLLALLALACAGLPRRRSDA